VSIAAAGTSETFLEEMGMTLRHPKPTAEQNAGRLVRRAAQVLEDRKWIQGDVGNGQRGMCAQGAICFAAHGNANFVSVPDLAY
jgi:hypothetical protein